MRPLAGLYLLDAQATQQRYMDLKEGSGCARAKSSCPHHEQIQMSRDVGSNFCWTRWKTGKLIVPAPEELFRRGAKHLEHLIETVDESWIKSIPLVKGPCPQPDFAVGLKPSAFTSDQLKKLQPSLVIGRRRRAWWPQTRCISHSWQRRWNAATKH